MLPGHGLSRKSLEAAIEAVRGGQKVDSAEAEGQREALKKYTLDLTEVLKDSDEAWSFTYKRLPATLETSESGGQTATITTTGTATMTATDENFTVTVVCDPKSYLYLNGTTIDYKDEIMGSGFVFNNPNSTSTWGCGSSFSA